MTYGAGLANSGRRVPLYSTPTSPRTAEDRGITGQLYGGDNDMRPSGNDPQHRRPAGSSRWAREPTVCHMNEEHSAFQSLEHSASSWKNNLDFAAAGHRDGRQLLYDATPFRQATMCSRRN